MVRQAHHDRFDGAHHDRLKDSRVVYHPEQAVADSRVEG